MVVPIDERRVRTACAANCGGRSLLDCTVRDGRLVKVEAAPMPDARYTNLCVRCLTLPQWVYGEERIRTPMQRVGERGEGRFEPISWDEALDRIASTFRRLHSEHGGESIGFAGTSGASHLGDYGRLRDLLQSSNLFGGVDMAVHMGLNAMFGFKGTFGQSTNEWTDRINAKVIVIWGHNPAETSLTYFRFLLDAQEAGSTLVVVDPRYSATAMHADWWVAPRSGTDLALALGLMHVLVDERLVDEEFVLRHSVGPLLVREDDGRWLRASDLGEASAERFMVWDDERGVPVPDGEARQPALRGSFTVGGHRVRTAYSLLEDVVAAHPPARTEAITGVPAADVRDLARLYGTQPPGTIGLGYGIDRYFYADMLARALGTLAVLTGNIGRPGATVGVASHGRGSHELDIRHGPFSAKVRAGLPAWARSVSVPNIDVGKRPLPVRALFNQGDWLNQRIADLNTVLEWMKGLELIVTVDHFWQTTCRWSDLVLPACTFLESSEPLRDLITARNCIIARGKVIEPLWESRSDFDIEQALAERLGFGEYFTESLMDKLGAILDQPNMPGMAGITLDRLVSEGGAMRLDVPTEPGIQYADLRFDTPTGRAEFYLERLVSHGEQLPVWKEDYETAAGNPARRRYPLAFTQNHVRQRAHSTYFNTGWTLEIWPEPIVELSPTDAEGRGIQTGDEVEVFNDRGRVVVVAVINPDYPDGLCNISEGWKQQQFRAGNLQELTNTRENLAQTAMWAQANFPFYDTRVEVRKTAAGGR